MSSHICASVSLNKQAVNEFNKFLFTLGDLVRQLTNFFNIC